MLYWLPSILWMGVIFYLSGRTGGQLNSMFPFLNSFNWGHLVAYFILGFLVYYAFSKTSNNRWIAFGALFICFIYGLTDEYHQSFVPGRSPELLDLFNDVLGAGMGILFYHRWFKKKESTYKG